MTDITELQQQRRERLSQADRAEKRYYDWRDPEQTIEVELVVAKSRGPLGGTGTGVPDSRAGTPDTIENEDRYGVHIRDAVDPPLDVGVTTQLRSDCEVAITRSDYEYADFGPEAIATAVIERHKTRGIGTFNDHVQSVDLQLDAAAVR